MSSNARVQVQLLKDIELPRHRKPFYRRLSRIEYDAKAPRAKKIHQLISQQGPCYGSVGDSCEYLTHDQLLQLERDGFIRITGLRREAAPNG